VLTEGQRIGSIRLLARLGAGGMGEVWEGLEEDLGRRVAVKVLRPAEGTTAPVHARFGREARILSQLEHPNICRLYRYLHAGELDVLVLELVRGQPLSRAIEEGLSASQRLEIALGVASALLAAHSVSVVHRDLKPDNVMLAEDGSLKVLDFGVARWEREEAAREVLPDRPRGALPAVGDAAEGLLTTAGEVVGTPRYMSPEQARGDPATAAGDMFAFGLLLFELYTGRPAYGPGTVTELLLRAQWADIPAVSGAGRAIATLVHDLTRLEPHLRPTAAQALERLRRIQRRPLRRVQTAAAFVAVAGLLVGSALSTIGLTRARREADAARATTDLLVGLFQGSDPNLAPSPDITAREVLDRGVVRVRDELDDQPAIRARLLAALGGIYNNLGLHSDALALLEEALRLHEELSGGDDRALLAVLAPYGNTLTSLGEHRRAEQVLRRAVAVAEHEGQPAELATVLNLLASLMVTEGRLDEAEALAERVFALRERVHGRDHPETAAAMVNLALVELDRGRFAEAESMLAAALVTLERRLGPDHLQVAQAVNNLATARKGLGHLDEAEALYRRALASLVGRLGSEHSTVAVIHNDLAVVLLEQGRFAEAEAEYERAVDVAVKSIGPAHPVTAIFQGNLAESILLQGRGSEAEPLYRRSLAALRDAFGSSHAMVADVTRGLGRTCASLGRVAEAEELLLESTRTWEAVGGSSHPELGKALTQLGSFYLDCGRPEDAEPVLARARGILEAAYPPGHPARRDLEAVTDSGKRGGAARQPGRGRGGST